MKPPEMMGGRGGAGTGFLDTLTRGNIRLAGNGRRLRERMAADGFLRGPHLQINDLRLSVTDTLAV